MEVAHTVNLYVKGANFGIIGCIIDDAGCWRMSDFFTSYFSFNVLLEV